jgi:serine O-acetyltransferase
MGAHDTGSEEALKHVADPFRRVRQAWREMVQAVRADHAMLNHYDSKYAPGRRGPGVAIGHDLVTRVGFQMLAACRVMRFCAGAGVPFAPRVASRMIRHLYGSDIHWEAELEPGIVFVHGMGLAISRAARVERGAILFQNVTLGMGIDADSRVVGAPIIEQDVHVGAGTTMVGPIRVGARSKVTANCFVRTSVPPDSLVEAPTPTVSTRKNRRESRGALT